jgi:hypothetical protein
LRRNKLPENKNVQPKIIITNDKMLSISMPAPDCTNAILAAVCLSFSKHAENLVSGIAYCVKMGV